MNNFNEREYNPDILTCLANLSNDEVFTSPKIVNQMLDMLPDEIWHDSKVTFLDPVCKSGVFLREIAKRLIEGLKEEIPDLQERIDHIFHKQIYGIAITELTSLISRRSLYCSKYPNSRYSLSYFENIEGNIRYKRIEHKWKNDKCIFCSAPKSVYNRGKDLETYAYEWIHTNEAEKIFNMKFDVIIGNPPYQMNDGGAQASAIPIYDKFIEQAKKLNPRYLTMIIPSRWFTGGKNLNEFRNCMLKDRHLKELVDYPVSTDCFSGVKIEGGICYFLWDKDYLGMCKVSTIKDGKKNSLVRELLEKNINVFIRYNEAVSIYKKVALYKEKSFSLQVSSRKPFGLSTLIEGKECSPINTIKLYGNKKISYIPISMIKKSRNLINEYKIFISYAYGAGGIFPHQIINKPFIGEPGSVCTETYLLIGPYKNLIEAKNVISYICTKFFRFLVLLLKNTQHATKTVYRLVPVQDFSKPWTDKELYAKYKLSQEEIDFIEAMIKPMELGGEIIGK